MIKQEVALFKQPMFRGIVVGGTGVTLAVMLGSLGLLRGRDASGFQYGWSWWSAALFAMGFAFTRSFWRAVFRAGDEPGARNKSKVVYHLFILGAIGAGCFLYPIRFLGQEHYFAVARGLFTAVLFLGTVGVLLFKLGQGLFANELKDGESA